MVGLGKMGANMAIRLVRGRHWVVAYDINETAIQSREAVSAEGARTLAEVVGMMDAPRSIWVMVPSGDITEQTIIDLDIAAPVITLALQRSLLSRSESQFSDRLLAAMRHQFGGHAVKNEQSKE